MRGLTLLAGVVVLAGCSPSSTQMTITVRPTAKTNQSRPMYVLVRSVDQKTYLAEPYATVAGKVVAPDASVLDAEVVFPGVDRAITVKKPDKDAIAVYFLFTDPQGRWKTLLGQQVSSSVDIHVGDNQIDNPPGGD